MFCIYKTWLYILVIIWFVHVFTDRILGLSKNTISPAQIPSIEQLTVDCSSTINASEDSSSEVCCHESDHREYLEGFDDIYKELYESPSNSEIGNKYERQPPAVIIDDDQQYKLSPKENNEYVDTIDYRFDDIRTRVNGHKSPESNPLLVQPNKDNFCDNDYEFIQAWRSDEESNKPILVQSIDSKLIQLYNTIEILNKDLSQFKNTCTKLLEENCKSTSIGQSCK